MKHKVKHIVTEITFEKDEIEVLIDVFEAARMYLDRDRGPFDHFDGEDINYMRNMMERFWDTVPQND